MMVYFRMVSNLEQQINFSCFVVDVVKDKEYILGKPSINDCQNGLT
jgi:hypothetical protein